MPFDFSIALFLALCGFFIAAISSSLGIGGGVFSFPLLLYTGRPFLPEDHLAVMGISGSLLMAVLFSASASYKNHHYNQIRYTHALALLAGSIPGSILTTNWAIKINTDILVFVFASFLAVNGLLGLYRILRLKMIRARTDGNEIANEVARNFNATNLSVLIAAGFLVGVASALTGIGGGVLMVPLLLNYMRLEPRDAVSTSTFCILWITLSGSLGYQWKALHTIVHIPQPRIGFLYLPLVGPLLAGGVLGGLVGSVIGNRLSPILIRGILALLQVVIALKMFYDSL